MSGWFSRPISDTQITHGRRLWLYAVGGLVMLFLVIPSLIVIPMSFSDSQYLSFPPQAWSLRWYESYFGSLEWMQATWTSLKAGILTMLVATPLGTLAAYGLHVSRTRLGGLAMLVLVMPIMMPLILIGIGVFNVYVHLGLLNTLPGVVIAHSMLALPLVVLVVASGLKSYDMNQELAACSLGASRPRAFLLVTLPQIRFSVVTAALLAFLTSFDEVIVALFVSGGQNSTLTRNMFLALRDQIDPTIAAISTVMIVVTSLLLAMSQLFGRSDR
jgi:putative spermidine/putrescine transport system permease protein